MAIMSPSTEPESKIPQDIGGPIHLSKTAPPTLPNEKTWSNESNNKRDNITVNKPSGLYRLPLGHVGHSKSLDMGSHHAEGTVSTVFIVLLVLSSGFLMGGAYLGIDSYLTRTQGK